MGMELEQDAWLSGILQKAAFRVSGAANGTRSHCDLVKKMRVVAKRGPAFFYTRASTRDIASLRRFSEAGFYVVETNVLMERRPAARLPEFFGGRCRVRPVVAKDADRLLDIAGTSFEYSRFHLDPEIPRRVADRIKREWIQSYIDGKRGDELLVAEKKGKAVGFLAVLAKREGRLSLRIIDLLAVSSRMRGHGVGRSLVGALVRGGAGRCHRLRVGTQAANGPALRFYENCGFRVKDTAYVMHAHSKRMK